LNPHLLVRDSDRLQLQRYFFGRLLQTVPCYLVNTGAGSVETVQAKLVEALDKAASVRV